MCVYVVWWAAKKSFASTESPHPRSELCVRLAQLFRTGCCRLKWSTDELYISEKR